MSTAMTRTLREIAGLEQQEMADLLNVSLRTYQRWESPYYAGRVPQQEVEDILTPIIINQQKRVDSAVETANEHGDASGIFLVRYRTLEALNRKHPGFPGGLNAHNATINAMARELFAEGHQIFVIWDDEIGANVEFQYKVD